MLSFFKKKEDAYSSKHDFFLRLFCLYFVRKSASSRGKNTTSLCEEAEQMRNYLRFGTPYEEHWNAKTQG